MDGVHSEVHRQLIGPAFEGEASLPDAPGPGQHGIAPPRNARLPYFMFVDEPVHTVTA
ncbi:hypothetical protein D3C81_2333910 [compost metagenome]